MPIFILATKLQNPNLVKNRKEHGEEFLKLVKEKTEELPEIKIVEEDESIETEMPPIPDNMITEINASCSYCHSIFLGDFKVYKCENCNAYYHEPCFQKMYKEINACRYCGAKIILK